MLANEEFLNNIFFLVTQGFESVHSTTLKIDTKNNPPKILSKMWRWWNDERKQKIEMSERILLRKDLVCLKKTQQAELKYSQWSYHQLLWCS